MRGKSFVLIFIACSYCFFLSCAIFAQTSRANISPKTQKLVENGVRLAEREDKVVAGLAQIKQAIAAAPHFVTAHAEYIRLKSYWLNEAAQTQAEYEALMKKEPENAVYPLALATGATFASAAEKQKWFNAAARLAPSIGWGHYAKAKAVEQSDTTLALEESLKAIEKDPTELIFYRTAFSLLLKRQKFAEAAAMIEQVKAQPQGSVTARRFGWDLLLADSGNSAEAKTKLLAELDALMRDSKDAELLLAVRARLKTLRDEPRIAAVEAKITLVDPTWYQERGEVMFTVEPQKNMTRSFYAGRQNQIFKKLKALPENSAPNEQMREAEALLAQATLPGLKTIIYKRILAAAVTAKDRGRAVKYGEMLLVADPNDASTLEQLARGWAEEKSGLDKALQYSARAVELTNEYRPSQPANKNGVEKNTALNLPDTLSKEIYKTERAQILNTRAFVLAATGNYAEAETLLRQSLEQRQTAETYAQLEQVLRKLNRPNEAARVAAENEVFWKKAILAKFKKEPAEDFELTTIKNERLRLSALKGKIVLINFWATWCKPCIDEMPILNALYDKYKAQGLEILAVSVDTPDMKELIPAFAAKHAMNFPVLFDENVRAIYDVNAFPTTLFIDRQGNLRYRTKGLSIKTAQRDLEFVITELMKNES